MDRSGDLCVVEAEQLPQHEHGALQRAEAFQQEQRRQRQRVGQLRRPLGIVVGLSGHRFGEPVPDIGLSSGTCGAQLINTDPGDHGGEVGLGRGRFGGGELET